MALLFTSSIISQFTGQLVNHFDTFSAFNQITVFKEPIKTITPINNEYDYAGYGNTSNETITTFTPVSGIFNAIVVHKNDQNVETFPETFQTIDKRVCYIKVKDDAFSYINKGETRNIQVDGTLWNLKAEEFTVKNYLGLKYYIFYLESVA